MVCCYLQPPESPRLNERGSIEGICVLLLLALLSAVSPRLNERGSIEGGKRLGRARRRRSGSPRLNERGSIEGETRQSGMSELEQVSTFE